MASLSINYIRQRFHEDEIKWILCSKFEVIGENSIGTDEEDNGMLKERLLIPPCQDLLTHHCDHMARPRMDETEVLGGQTFFLL
jgi:hypothetical protein